jgi:hypothetical protein
MAAVHHVWWSWLILVIYLEISAFSIYFPLIRDRLLRQKEGETEIEC